MSLSYNIEGNVLTVHDFRERFDYRTSQEWREQIRTLWIDDEAFLGCTGLRRVFMRSKHIKEDRWLPEELRGRVTVER